MKITDQGHRRILYGLLGILFVILFAFALILRGFSDTLDHLSSTVDNTDEVVNQATSPEAQEAQKKVVQELLQGMNCQDQINLQRLVDALASLGASELASVVVVEPDCQPPLNE